MSWQNDPIVAEPSAPAGSAPSWAGDPELSPEPTGIPEPTMGQVALNAIPKGMANLVNTPVTIWNLLQAAAAGMHPQIKEEITPVPNYPLQAAEQMGLVDPNKEPQTGPQRIVDMAIQTAIGAAAIPAGGLAGAAKGAAIGAASGGAAQTTKELTGSDLLAAAVGMATPFVISGLGKDVTSFIGTETRKQTLKEARSVGYVVEPSSVKRSAAGAKLESVAGKAAIAQDAVVRNQTVTNRLAAKSLGLPEETPLSMAIIDEVRDRAALPYKEVEALRASTTDLPWFPRYHNANLLEEVKQARADTTALFRQYDRMGDPAILKAAKASASNVQSLEDDITKIAIAAGKPDLLARLRAARELYARSYDIERALNLGDGNISAPIIGRMLDQGRPLSGELKVIGKFAQAFPRVAREAAGIAPPAVSGTDMASAAILGTTGVGAAGPAGVMAGGLPLVRGPVRNLVLSEGYQSSLLKPTPPPTPLTTTAMRAAIAGKTSVENAKP